MAQRSTSRTGRAVISARVDGRQRPHASNSVSDWRAALATGVASAALFAYGGRPVRAQTVPPAAPCNQISGTSGEIVTCSGDVSTGVLINSGSPFSTLNVGNLTTNITPASGDDGIFFTSVGGVTVNSNTGPFAIIATGAGADGIEARSTGAGAVTVTSSGDITSALATGIRAYSVSGAVAVTTAGTITAGGDGIFAQTGNATVTVDNTADIFAGARGIFASSLNEDLSVSSEGNIQSVGRGIDAHTNGDLTIESTGDIATTGSAEGIYAYNYNGTIAIASTGDITTQGAGGYGIRSFGSLGATSIASLGNITTAGNSAMGIGAYSLEADVAIASTGNIKTSGNSAHGIFAFVRQGTGDVAITSMGNITTTGAGAAGIFVNVNVYGSGDIAIASFGNITTSGTAADGIAAVTSGSVEIVNTGDISATANGIYAGGQAGNLVINIGTIEGCPCAGVLLVSNGNNRLYNYGAIIAAPGGNAIESEGADSQVENCGVVTGNVLFFDGMNPGTGAFTNHAGALFNTGTIVEAGLVTNDGTLAPGGVGTLQMTALGDSFVQNTGGIFAVDVGGAAADELIVSDTAQLAGKVDVNVLSLPALTSYTILEGMGGLTNNGLGLIASPALNATLQFNSNDLDLVFAIDFSPALGLNPNQKAIAENLDQIFRAGVGGVGPVLLGLLNVDDLAEFKAALDQLSPEIYSNAEIAALYASFAFSNSLLSCKVNGTDTASIIREGQCLWAGASARFLDSSTTTDQIGFDETAGLFTAGAQVTLNDVWRLGAAGGFQSSSLQTATGAQSEGALAQGGVSLKYNPGALLLAGAVTSGGGWYDTTRLMSFGGFTGVVEGEQTLGVFNAAFRAAYVFGDPELFFKPILDANLTHLELGGFTESGGNGAALSVDGGGSTVFSLAPMLEAGTEWWLGNGTLIRPLIRAGAVWYEGGDFALTASFAGAPAGVSPFTINTDIDEVMGLIGAGVEVINGGDAVLRLSYDGQLGADTQIHSVGIKGSAKF